jgi:hypothetical protein
MNSTNENEEKSTGLLVVAHQQLKDQVGIDQAAVSIMSTAEISLHYQRSEHCQSTV